ncbi:ANTAR domain-containing protein [Lentzea xinjiangensis]|uniref:ANTAR domain-containing protein n=1 Tax=Lentzea xinjiangensis TaxID=402600 RepID=A0A1H9VBR2_9PSEU|nr:GAF and ANTAR domain-containing protein [Lentzea xinjiangensis]SES18971.1 ANTAR domain-containing protein [Lentzea xinjiangensis]
MVDGRRYQRLWRLVTARARGRDFSGWAGVVCVVAVEDVGVDGAAISLRSSGRAQELAAASGSWARGLEELQYSAGDGPGVEAFTTARPVFVTELDRAGQRWPGFLDTATGLGLAAVFSFPLQAGAVRLGTLDLYRREPGALPADRLADAAVLADLATGALLIDAASGEGASWAQADLPGHYDDVNVAAGMLATALRISVDDAFLRLRARAFSSGEPLLGIARSVLDRRLRLDLFLD